MRWWVWWLVSAVGLTGAHELDPAACSARFDVQRDKIIRTEESREMGARYLSELDVGARAECLRLCCETDSCDVFVFEEKSPGSCYLFNCGPPEDFRCKFTAHGNFSSGVLALSRRLAELQDQERLAHHERELANLRSPTSTTLSSTPAVRSTTPPRPPPPPRPPQPPEPAHEPPPPLLPRRCSRYQFECRRGGECIAVYNACDGVPQCADGSDEAPELGCPPSVAPPAPPAPPVPVAPPSRTSPPVLQIHDDIGESGEPWPHRLAQAQPQHRHNTGNAADVGGSHIFSHKGGLLQDGAFEPPAWPQRINWPPPALPGVDGPDAPEGLEGAGPDRWGGDWGAPRRAWPVPRARPEIPLYMPSKTMPEMPMVYSSQQQTLRDSPKKGFELMRVEVPTPPTAAPAPLTPVLENTTKKKVLQDTKSQTVAAVVSAARVADESHDGRSERPPAALLLLVLGSLLTAALGALLGCRARAARRRRRAHPRLALDADYLVNGMYL